MAVSTASDPQELRMRLRFICNLYGDDVDRAVRGMQARVEALRESGVAAGHVFRAAQEASTWKGCGVQNQQLLRPACG
jgi:hypothetical protein